jgi:hypothetical protein
MVEDLDQVKQPVATSIPLDRVTLADWSEATRFRFCSFEYSDISGGHWSVECTPAGEPTKPVYQVYNHRLGGQPSHTTDLGAVARLLTSCSSGCLPASIWGTIGAHPWRTVDGSSVATVVRAAAEGRIFGEFGETLPNLLPRLAAQLLLCSISPAEEAVLVRRLEGGERGSFAQQEPF